MRLLLPAPKLHVRWISPQVDGPTCGRKMDAVFLQGGEWLSRHKPLPRRLLEHHATGTPCLPGSICLYTRSFGSDGSLTAKSIAVAGCPGFVINREWSMLGRDEEHVSITPSRRRHPVLAVSSVLHPKRLLSRSLSPMRLLGNTHHKQTIESTKSQAGKLG